MSSTVFDQPPLPTGAARCVLFSQISSEMRLLKGQCPDCAHARASSVFSSNDNGTVILLRQDFLPERTADEDLLFTISSNISDFRRRFSSYLKFGSRHEDSSRFCRYQGRLATRKSRSARFKNSFSNVKLVSEVNCSKSSNICLIFLRSSHKRLKDINKSSACLFDFVGHREVHLKVYQRVVPKHSASRSSPP